MTYLKILQDLQREIDLATSEISQFDYKWKVINAYPTFEDLLLQASQTHHFEKLIEKREIFRDIHARLLSELQTV